MFTCPDKDIHSIYLDNELPDEYIRKYEDHIKSCSKCRAELEKMRAVRNLFQADSKTIMLDSHALEQSFERLQSRLHYTRITRRNHVHVFPAVKWAIPVAAAAAVLAVIVPVRTGRVVQAGNGIFAISRQKPAPIAQANVVVSGNIPHAALTSLFKSSNSGEAEAVPPMYVQFTSFGLPYENDEKDLSAALTGIDVFRPEFGDQDTLPVRILVPHLGYVPFSSGVQIPQQELLKQ